MNQAPSPKSCQGTRQRVLACGALLLLLPGLMAAAPQAPAAQAPAAQAQMPPEYVVGPGDMLSIVVWRDRDLTQDVVVRPDGRISLPLLNDVPASGLTPDQLRLRLTELARKFSREEPVVTVVVRQINSTRVFITGMVLHPGAYVLTGPTTVLQLIAVAGGFADFANRNKILIARVENGVQRSYFFNYDDVVKKGNLAQNIMLRSGDTIVVP